MISVRCPICERWIHATDRSAVPDFPFCSSRCRLIDLGRWLGEKYALAAPAEVKEPADDADGDATIP